MEDKNVDARRVPITVRVPPELLAGIDQFCAVLDVTRPEAVHMIILDWMAKHQVIKGD